MSQKIKIRLYINQDLSRSPEIVPGEAQVHYLNNVLRLEDGAVLAAFDGINGEYSFRLRKNGKKSLVLERIENCANFICRRICGFCSLRSKKTRPILSLKKPASSA